MSLSTPILWVIVPLLTAVIAGVFYNRRIFGVIFTSSAGLILALLAAFFPENLQWTIGPLNLVFDESLGILGRQITVAYEILPFVTFIYAATALWNLGSGLKSVPVTFRPTSFVIAALLTAAIGVEPFLYAALLIETAVLVSIPMLSPLKEKIQPGILRFIILQTIAMPFILLAGWLLTGVEALPADSELVGQTMLVLGLGFALLLGVFPFHSWLPMVSESSHPTVTSYLNSLLPSAILVFGLAFINRYPFLRSSEDLFQTLRVMGALMIVIGGSWTAVQNNLKRAFGFSVLTETGISLLAMGLSNQGGLTWLLMLLPARALGFWLWQYTLTLLESHLDSLEITALTGVARRYPILSIGLLIAQSSLAGLPLFASFPTKIALITGSFNHGTSLGLWVFAGNLGLLLFTIRLLRYLVMPDPNTPALRWLFSEQTHEYLPVLVLIAALILLGLFPNAFPTNIIQTLTAFSQLR